MKDTHPSRSFLEQAAQIQRMERGKLSVMRQGPNGPYFKLQTWQKGRNVSRYIPASQASAYQEAVQGYQEYQRLVEQHAQQVMERTRADIAASLKRKTNSPRQSPRPRTPNSNS
jgi:macrodomain Ter protein organizer (MatP/YcbG family)